ncbi:MAG: DUF1127 domain-containing protein [Acetobacteraceae bacterium]|nr:DUF1127 domain-containing protein [Acetobacteraceae bacterium]
MAISTTTTRVLPASTPTRSPFARIIAAFERRQERARIRGELSLMSDRELADLGLVQSDIADVAAGIFRRD